LFVQEVPVINWDAYKDSGIDKDLLASLKAAYTGGYASASVLLGDMHTVLPRNT
jgi:hypothetical protein